MVESTFIDARESILATGGSPVQSPLLIQFFSQRQQKQWREEEKKSLERIVSVSVTWKMTFLNCQKALL